MRSMDRFVRYKEELKSLAQSSNLRSLPKGQSSEVNLCSNDYLALGDNYELQQCFIKETSGEDLRLSATSSRLLSGTFSAHLALESKLEELYGRPALLFSTGYQLNSGVLPSITTSRSLIIADKLVHASIIDGIRLSSAKSQRFRHQDLGHLERILKGSYEEFEEIIVVVESIYSMDGDCADLLGLIALKAKYPKVILYVDEAHAVGVRGEGGLGLCEELGCTDQIDILCGTFGKALASVGAFVVCHPTLKEYLINRTRTLIFTTALPPINCAWTLWVLERLGDLKPDRERLEALSRRLREGLEAKGYSTPSQSHIIPIIVGQSSAAVERSERLRNAGFNALAVRPPTVAEGTSRLRLSLNSSLSDSDIDRLLEII